MYISDCYTQGASDDDDDDETHAFTYAYRREPRMKRDGAHMKRGNYNRTNPGHIKRLTEDLFYFTLCHAAFFCPLVGEFSINDAIEG